MSVDILCADFASVRYMASLAKKYISLSKSTLDITVQA